MHLRVVYGLIASATILVLIALVFEQCSLWLSLLAVALALVALWLALRQGSTET